MATELTRRRFLQGSAVGTDAGAIRPPGAHRTSFAELCRDCDLCSKACPEQIITMDQHGQPVVEFEQGACTFCGACADACPTGALHTDLVEQWPWRARINSGCLSRNGVICRSCQDACESRAIRFRLQTGGRAEPILDRDTCTGCGACVSVCPVQSVELEAVPSAMKGVAA